ncbi:single-stranded DNA-binding protein [Candidatus Peregrinibacteria bacterium HGW-Peregrinibacteria-1]|jgi:single-strand DNA-binding protein|nr:MAG: single-stranded DNA-binding protein [Candidatus Peregrinibacteria bacterium HGW-Peregrinibacteria-1]
MRSVNKVIIIGNLTRAPELRSTPSGQQVATFGVATNRDWTTREGEKRSSAEFHECVAWAKLAEICEKHISKGTLVYIEGYLKTRSWDGENGNRKFKTEIVVQELTILNKKSFDDDSDDNEETYHQDSSRSEDNFKPERITTPDPEPQAPAADSQPPEDIDTFDDDPISKDLGL